MDKNTVARRSMDHFFASLGVELPPSTEVGSWDLMIRLVGRGMGVGVIPREYVENQLRDGTLIELKTEVSLPARSIGMLLPRNAPVSYALHSFISEFSHE